MVQYPDGTSSFLRQICISPDDGRLWFSLGTIAATFEPSIGYCLHSSLFKSLTISPRDEAATRTILRLHVRLFGPASAVGLHARHDLLSRSYESTGVLGVALLDAGDVSGAIDLFQRCLVTAPERREAAERLGQIFADMGRYGDAAAMFSLECRIDPANDEARSRWLLSRFREGELQCYHDLLLVAETGGNLQSRLNAGMAAVDRQLWDEANRLMSKALATFPGSSDAWSKSAIPLILNGDLLIAQKHVNRSLSIDAMCLEARVNLGRILEALGQIRAAITEYEAALQLRPGLPEPRLNAASCHLGLAQFDVGWEYYAARWASRSIVNYSRYSMSRYLPTSRPRLTHPAADLRVLVWTEQGIGDEIMFSSMFSELADQTRQVIATVDDRLISLFKRSFREIRFFGRSERVPESLYDFQLPVGDLGSLFRRSIRDFEGRGTAFLTPDTSRVNEYRSCLRESRKFVVGISWYSTSPNTGSVRSVSLQRLISTLDRPQLKFVCLQYGKDVADEIRVVRDRTGIDVQLVPNLDPTMDIDGVAAAAVACDLVVSVGNSVAHIAAACGCPTWLLASVGASWRWMFEGERTPWYDSVRIFRQKKLGDWDVVLEQLSAALDAKLRDELR